MIGTVVDIFHLKYHLTLPKYTVIIIITSQGIKLWLKITVSSSDTRKSEL